VDGVAGDGIGRLATSRDGWQPMSDESAMFLPFFSPSRCRPCFFLFPFSLFLFWTGAKSIHWFVGFSFIPLN